MTEWVQIWIETCMYLQLQSTGWKWCWTPIYLKSVTINCSKNGSQLTLVKHIKLRYWGTSLSEAICHQAPTHFYYMRSSNQNTKGRKDYAWCKHSLVVGAAEIKVFLRHMVVQLQRWHLHIMNVFLPSHPIASSLIRIGVTKWPLKKSSSTGIIYGVLVHDSPDVKFYILPWSRATQDCVKRMLFSFTRSQGGSRILLSTISVMYKAGSGFLHVYAQESSRQAHKNKIIIPQ